ncbi:E3 ubiquitin-protein ligase RHF2A-like protein [Drosera capensis]
MEAVGMDGSKKVEEADLTSAAAFVEGGIQEACDDSCSICLEEFCDSDPSTVTGCKHEFHLHCILEWCQRSSQCPMCFQAISLKDPSGQELLDAVVQERNIRLAPPRSAAIFHHPAVGDFEIQDLPVGVNDAELEERIIQHLAAAAAMGRARHLSRRDGHRRSSAQGRPHFLVFSSHPNAHTGSPSSISLEGGDGESDPVSTSVTNIPSSSQPGTPSNYRSSPSQSSPSSHDRAGPSDFQSLSEALRSRFNAVSLRYKETISKSTRGWKERWLSRNSAMADLGSDVRRDVNTGIATTADLSSEVRREINAGIATMADLSSEMRRGVNASISTASRMIERLETRNSSSSDPVPNNPESSLFSEPRAEGIVEDSGAGDDDDKIYAIEGLEGLLRIKDIQSLTGDVWELFVSALIRHQQAKAIIFNTFEDLEAPFLSYDRSCITWIDAQPSKSVVYVSFGSQAVLKSEELLELWHGLVDSGKKFLWVMRESLEEGNQLTNQKHLIDKVLAEGRGYIVPFAPQMEVLAHPAVGSFLTHCGWNSTLECLVSGVPMICWPYGGDQPLNGRYMSEVLKLGVYLKDYECERGVIARVVNEVMEQRKNELCASAASMAAACEEAITEGGSSHKDFDGLFDMEYLKGASPPHE